MSKKAFSSCWDANEKKSFFRACSPDLAFHYVHSTLQDIPTPKPARDERETWIVTFPPPRSLTTWTSEIWWCRSWILHPSSSETGITLTSQFPLITAPQLELLQKLRMPKKSLWIVSGKIIATFQVVFTAHWVYHSDEHTTGLDEDPRIHTKWNASSGPVSSCVRYSTLKTMIITKNQLMRFTNESWHSVYYKGRICMCQMLLAWNGHITACFGGIGDRFDCETDILQQMSPRKYNEKQTKWTTF